MLLRDWKGEDVNQIGTSLIDGIGWLVGWVGLGWVGLGWVGLGWVGLGGLGWVGLGWVVGWLEVVVEFEGKKHVVHFFPLEGSPPPSRNV